MITTYATNLDFVVAQQLRDRRWVPHRFRDKDQFVEWMAAQPFPKPVMVDRRTARGRMLRTEDHRDDYGFFY